ncbi:GHKL domain-containing protein [Fulvivirga sp. 29W222]|uniref:histidine kinase n=1 Tax=Fulvivirga marina TaxID=2494733 RepID=A0A937G0T6_9BACT|nr:two-component regulator propeller domain-containing protein [Fulvivirga marina]MBL6448452.1 GHKL domain-containing protein [Fulvivirga marina]
MLYLFKSLLLILTLLLTGSYASHGQSKRLSMPGKPNTQYYVDRWTTDDGLPANTLTYVHKSNKGYIWISSYDGIVKFDGIEFKTYNRAKNDLPSNAIAQIEEDSKHKLWIGTYGEGLMSYENGEFKSENNESLKAQSIQTIYINNEDRIWIGTRGNGLHYRENNVIKKFRRHPSIENITISAIIESEDGELWIGTEGNGLVKYKDNNFQVFTMEDGLPEDHIAVVYFDSVGTMWVGTNIGLTRFNGKSFELINEIGACFITKMFEDKQNNLWVASDCGLFKKLAGSTKWLKLPLEEIIPGEFFTDAFVDEDGSIWGTTYYTGLALIRKSKFINYTVQDGLASQAISSVAQYDDSTFLIGTNTGVINTVRDGEVGRLDLKTNLPDRRVRSILKDSKGNLWVGTSMGLLLKKKSGEEKWYTMENGLPDIKVRLVYEDSHGTIWIGTRAGGLAKVTSEDQFAIINKSTLLNSDFIMSIREDNQGNLLIGTNENGLNILQPDGSIKYITKENGLPSNLIFNTYTDKNNVTWIMTNAGICRMKGKNFFNITAAHGLATDAPFDFLEDEYGDVWLPTSKGVVKVSKKQLNDFAEGRIGSISFRTYDKQDGLDVAECTGAAKSLISTNGKIWIPALNGVFVIEPGSIAHNHTPPPVFVTNVIANTTEHKLKKDTIKLSPEVQRIVIKYEALNYTSPSKVKYRFMLEGFDKQWVDGKTIREAQYTNLKYGTYKFMVTASNEDGVWNENPAVLTIIVAPHFYETSGFMLGIILSAMLLIFGAFRLSLYNVEKRNKTLTALVQEQTSELRDINARLEEQKEELMQQHELLSEKNIELEDAHEKITHVNEELTKVNSRLEEKVEERTKDLSLTLERLKATNEELDTFIYRASHDLKGPTASLLGLAMLGKTLSKDPKYLDFFVRIEETSNNMNNILGKLLSMHVIMQTTVSYTPINLETLVHDIKKSLRVNKTNYKIINQAEDDLIFYSDQNLLKIILENLIENSLIFSELSRDITIKIKAKKKLSNIYLSVEDNGDGITTDIKPRIFDLFYRGSQRSKGNGLGLYLVKKAVQKLSGSIEVDSEVNKFTKFTVQLPSKDII